MQNQTQILISAGEASGEMHAARLAEAMRARTGAELFGLGGVRMREAGVDLVADSGEVAALGITEVVGKVPKLMGIFRRLAAEAARRKPELAVLVDFGAFNLKLAWWLKRQGVRNVYFISPQVWAWKQFRVKLIRERIERMICIFPFEEEFYRKRGVKADYVGHPLVDVVRITMTREEFAARTGLDAARPIVALLPGSRAGEIERNLPALAEACRKLERDRGAQFALAVAPGLAPEMIAGHLGGLRVKMVQGDLYNLLGAADVALVASGTATVEAALVGTPMVVVYRVSGTTAWIARRVVKTPFFSMVNLVAGREVAPELLQERFTAEAVAREALRLLDSREAREEMKRGLAEVKMKLTGPQGGGAIGRAAEIIAGMLEERRVQPAGREVVS